MISREPVRTCVGCRGRVAAAELLRVVVAPDPIGSHAPSADGAGVALVPDPRRRAAGRGAWVHPDPQCVETAVRRRAFARALRVPGAVDPSAVRDHIAQQPGAPSQHHAGTVHIPAEPRRR